MILIILFILMWYFLWKKKYYIRIESAGNDIPAMEQVLKTELETTLRHAIAITKQTPYLIEAGNYLNANSVVKQIRKHGGIARVTFHWAWQNPAQGQQTA